MIFNVIKSAKLETNEDPPKVFDYKKLEDEDNKVLTAKDQTLNKEKITNGFND
jgi:hypothetical protein